ncbi:hypothetical protein GE21DRAFT_1968 [Neurospora crassa]|uniref:Uncharacterized protein n=1 Tax=Neurospora crassa (strain ATCC 24698 / 74-OR23-1A / CBS 708.71 / DSM 1257 / FGSC 987) TaxID=367110 RepID=Q7SED2_NEUCR|nr:hypothetical protein NCU00746 [Neurospora crassa OR74A]EAA35163.1 hypothetical protein NCU00746 [Neurospora crassa OR74A]KHE89697.1 hypothetical protein GE21DRAFT_1968 [Neurospora crassa]|eukprot:XP_964399.1 hypothetical protein NCU00746 [Neurospora crassa OR74A]
MAITYISPRKLKKYYIDPSCDAKFDQQFDGFVQQAMEYARRAVNRLTSSSDLDFARVYETLFKMPKSDKQRFNWANDFRLMNPHSASVRMTAYEHVIGVLRDFATNWRRTPNHWEADVRFHCDAQTRFIPIHHSSSSSSSPRALTYLDPTNSVFNTGSFPSNLTRQAFTSYELSTEGSANGQVHNLFGLTGIQGQSNVQNPARVVIDLGQATWEAFSDSTRRAKRKTSTRYHDNASVSDLGMLLKSKVESKVDDDVSQWSSVPKIIFHEMMHCRYYGLCDANANATVGWQSCMDVVRWGSGPSCVVLNAESYAMLGLMAWLADIRPDDEETAGGYTLSREDEGERVKGVVRFYADITA